MIFIFFKTSGLAPMLTMKAKFINRNSASPIYLLKVKHWKRKMKIL